MFGRWVGCTTSPLTSAVEDEQDARVVQSEERNVVVVDRDVQESALVMALVAVVEESVLVDAAPGAESATAVVLA